MIIDEYEYDGEIYVYWIGQNAKDNWLTIDSSDESDIFFHVKDSPSSHVILKTYGVPKSKLPKSVIKHGAIKCVQHSKCKDTKNVEVLFTEVSNIKKAEKIGSVYCSDIKIIIV